MKGKGIDNTLKFILKETSPVLEIRGGVVEESDKKLIQGTIVEGILKTRVVKIGKEKIPYKFIELKNKQGYLSPSSLNVYISKFANLEGGFKSKDIGDTKETAFGEKPTKKQKIKNIMVNYGLPIIGGYLGYQVAKKMQADNKKMVGYIAFFALIGMIPRYLHNK